MSNKENIDGKFTLPQKVEIKSVHGDLSQEVITITVDKLKLILHQQSSTIENKNSWIAPTGILITIILTIITATFKDYILPQNVWHAIFIISLFLVSFWMIKSLWITFRSPTIEDLVEKIKEQK